MSVQISKVELPPVCPFCKYPVCDIVKLYKDGFIDDAWWVCLGCNIHFGYEQIRIQESLRWRVVKIIPPELPPGYTFNLSIGDDHEQ